MADGRQLTATAGAAPARLTAGREPVGVLIAFLVLTICVPAALIVAPLGASGTPGVLVGICALLLWCAAFLQPGAGLAPGFQPMRLAVGCFVASMLAAYVMAASVGLTAKQQSGADRGMLLVAAWAGVAFLATDRLATAPAVHRLLRWLVLLSTLLAGLGMLQFATGVNIAGLFQIPGLTANDTISVIAQRSEFRRVAGTASHAIEFGVVLAMVLPLALHYALYGAHYGALYGALHGARYAERRGRWQRLWQWTPFAAIAAATPLSLSRSALLGAVAGLLVLWLSWPTRRRIAAVLLGLAYLVALRLAIPGLLGTFRSLFLSASADPSIQGRTEDYAVVGEFVAGSPWFGRGFRTFLPSDFFILDNQYLASLIETGVLGLACLILLLVVGFGCARGFRRRCADPAGKHLGQALAASIVVAAVGFATFDWLSFPMASSVLFVLLGCIGALWRQGADSAPVD